MNRAAAIRFLCRALAPPPDDGSLRRAIESGEVDWERMARVASAHLLSPALGPALDRKGLLAFIPEDFRDYLDAINELNAERNGAILAQLGEAALALNQAGIQPMPLKGLAAMLDGLWPDPSERLLRDIDLLLPEGKLESALAALRSIGYSERRELHGAPHHHWPLARAGDEATIELHFELGDEAFGHRTILSAGECRNRSRAATLESGARVRVPCIEDQLVHGILHAQLHHRGHRLARLDLRQLHELALLADRFPAEIDWPAIGDRFARACAADVLSADLLAAESLFAVPLPEAITPSPRARAAARRMLSAAGSPWRAILLHTLGKATLAAASPRRFAVFFLHLATPSWYRRRLREIASLLRGESK